MDLTANDEQAERIRKRYLYRRLVLTRKIALSRASATRLIGPDCAYHLYAHHRPTPPPPEAENAPAGIKA